MNEREGRMREAWVGVSQTPLRLKESLPRTLGQRSLQAKVPTREVHMAQGQAKFSPLLGEEGCVSMQWQTSERLEP